MGFKVEKMVDVVEFMVVNGVFNVDVEMLVIVEGFVVLCCWLVM